MSPATVSPPRQEQQTFLCQDVRLLGLKRDWSLRNPGARVGVSPSHLRLVEQGKRTISAGLALRLLRVLMLGDARPA